MCPSIANFNRSSIKKKMTTFNNIFYYRLKTLLKHKENISNERIHNVKLKHHI